MPKASISAFCHHEQQEGREELGREHTATGEGKVAGAPNGIRDFSIRRCNDLINFTCTREVGTIFCRRRELDLAHIRFFLFDRESQRHCLIEACAHYTWVHVCSHARALQKRHALRSAPPVFGPSDCATKAAETTARSPGRAQLDAKERAHTRSGSLSPLRGPGRLRRRWHRLVSPVRRGDFRYTGLPKSCQITLAAYFWRRLC